MCSLLTQAKRWGRFGSPVKLMSKAQLGHKRQYKKTSMPIHQCRYDEFDLGKKKTQELWALKDRELTWPSFIKSSTITKPNTNQKSIGTREHVGPKDFIEKGNLMRYWIGWWNGFWPLFFFFFLLGENKRSKPFWSLETAVKDRQFWPLLLHW